MSEDVEFHPQWLKPSAVPITIVCGPPCSGKTTYVQQRAKPDDIIIDLDTIMSEIRPGYKHWSTYESDTELLLEAIPIRNERLRSLATLKHGQAWFIVSAPTADERNWWQRKLRGKLVLLHPGVEECRRRAAARGTPYARHGVERWQAKATQLWSPRYKREPVQIGVDGWPTGR